MTFYQIIIFFGATLTCLQVIWPWISIQKIQFSSTEYEGAHGCCGLIFALRFCWRWTRDMIFRYIWNVPTKNHFSKNSSSWLLVVTRTYLYDFRSESYLLKSDGGKKIVKFPSIVFILSKQTKRHALEENGPFFLSSFQRQCLLFNLLTLILLNEFFYA